MDPQTAGTQSKGEEICRPMIRNHDGLQGKDIPLLARILQVADIYDALITERLYKPALAHTEALKVMEEEAERGWRDPELIPLFAEIASSVAAEIEAATSDGLMRNCSPTWGARSALERYSGLAPR